MQKLFGTDGMRGEAGSFPLDARTVQTVGKSLVVHLREKLRRSPLIVTGRDTRESGPWIENALTAGALATGAECRSAGVISTPGIAYLTRTIPADAGVVISASHNSYQDNGIKIFSPSGQKLDDETERLIEADVYTPSSQHENVTPALNQVDDPGLRSRYLAFLEQQIGKGMSLTGLRLVIDSANGAASNLGSPLLTALGATVTNINNSPDGRNINLDCGSLHMKGLQDRVVVESADLGVAFDGDADRALFVDSGGRFVDGDATLWIMAKYLQARGKLHDGLVVATVMSNIGLEIALGSRGLRLVRTNVGDKYVLEEILSSGAQLGGEQSGHIIFPGLSLAGDALITTLCLLRVMTEAGESLQELTQGFVRYPQILVNVRVREKQPFSEIESIRNLVAETESKLGTEGRLLLRYSGTEPLARIMIEGKDQLEIEKYASDLAHVIEKSLGA